MRLKQFLNQPVRVFDSTEKKWIYIITTMIFAAFFLLFYTPFGLNEEMEKESTTFMRIFSFVGGEVLAILIALYVFQFIILKEASNSPIVLKKYLRLFLLEMLCISILHNTIEALSTHLFFPHELIEDLEDPDELFSNSPILSFILDCILITIPQTFILSYPFMGCLLYFYVNDLKEEVNELTSELKSFQIKYKEDKTEQLPIKLLDENDQVEIILNLDQILALESNNQYVLLYYLDGDKTLCKQIIRTRLKKLLSELSHTPTLQCHRSYAVNLLKVEQLKRIDKKSFLSLSGTDQLKIPVSKTYLAEIKNRIS